MSILSSEITMLEREKKEEEKWAGDKAELHEATQAFICSLPHAPHYVSDEIINTNLISFSPSASMTCRICFGVIGASE